MKSEWLKRLKAKLEKAGIEVNESHVEMFKIFESNPARDQFADSFIQISRPQQNDDNCKAYGIIGDHLKETIFRADKNKETIIITNKENSFLNEVYEIDTDISPMLDRIEAQQLNNHIKWMRELT